MPRCSGGGPWTWGSFAEFLDRLDVGLSVNAGFLVGHSTVRRVVMGESASSDRADAAQLEAMADLVGESLAGGALGFSSSLGEGHLDGDHRPVPSSCAGPEEFVALAGALRDHPGTTLEFIPSIGPIPEERVELMADMSLAADRPLNWNLLGSLASEEIWEGQLRASDVAAAKGAHVVALALPDMMRMRSNTILPGLPGWREVMALDADGRRAAAADPDTRADLRAGAEKVAERAIGVLTDFTMMEVADADSPWVGRSLGSIAEERGTDVVDVLLDVVLPDDLTLYVVLPSLTPVPRPERRGLGGPGRRVEGPTGDARRLRRRGPPRSDVPRQLPDPGARRGRPPPRTARHRGGGGHDDRPPGPPLRAVAAGAGSSRGGTPTWSIFDPDAVDSGPAYLVADMPGGGERLVADSIGIDHVLVAGTEVVAVRIGHRRPGPVGSCVRATDTESVTLADVRR